MDPNVAARRDHDEYWSWLSVALFLLITVDLLTTFGAAARVGVGSEANPLVAALLAAPTWLLVWVNLVVVMVTVVVFAVVLRLLRRTPTSRRPRFRFVVETWLGLLIAVGLAVFANNLAVIVHGVSLL